MDVHGTQQGGNGRRDPFTAARWNDRVDVIIHPAPSRADVDVEQRTLALFGRKVDRATWARLVGAPDGATVHVLPSPAPDFRHGVQLRVEHPWFDGPAIRYVFVNVDGNLAMVNDQFGVRADAPVGVGTRVLAHEVRAAQALSVRDIIAEAAGAPGSRLNGYYTWARLGFDGPIPARVAARLPDRFAWAISVLDLIETAGGAEWWRANGRTYWGTFDLREGSRSLRVLWGYTRQRGIFI
jgi:hypothetical protein